MINSRKIFTGGLDADTDPRFIGEHDYLNMENCRVGISADGKTTRIENIAGTVEVVNGNLPESGDNICIGSAIDEEKRRLVYFIYNSLGYHCIFLFNTITQTIQLVLQNSNVTGGLEFTTTTFVDRNARIIDDILYWTIGVGDVWSINIQAALNMQAEVSTFPYYTAPIDSSLLRLIKQPPAFPPAIEKGYDSSFVGNFIYNEGFKFCWKFTYLDNEETVLSPYSLLAPLNGANDTYNKILVTLPIAQQVWQTVQKVDLVVIYSSTNVYYVIKTWDKAISADATAIANHNSGTELTYSFYNNKLGIVLDSAYCAKPYEIIPFDVKTLELARNRNFLGGGTYGYDAPKETSLSLNVVNIDTYSCTVQKQTNDIVIKAVDNANPLSGTVNLIYSVGNNIYGIQDGYYIYRYTYGTFAGTSVNFIDIIYGGLTLNDAGGKIMELFYTNNYYCDYLGVSSANTNITLNSMPIKLNSRYKIIKTGSTYSASVVFYDKYQRKCGASNEVSIITPEIIFNSSSSLYSKIRFELLNANAVNEIPLWADSFSVVLSKNQTCTSFLQGYSRFSVFYKKKADGTYQFVDTTNNWTINDSFIFGTNKEGIAFDISDLINLGYGYTFTEGDILKTNSLSSVNTFDTYLKIKGVSGSYVLCELKNIELATVTDYSGGAFTPPVPFIKYIEIYTPYKSSTNEFIYEIGSVYKVVNAGTINRRYDAIGTTHLLGYLDGDSSQINRQNSSAPDHNIGGGVIVSNNNITTPFISMSPNDKYWQQWYTSAGRPNIKDTIGQKALHNRIAFSNTYIAGTLINGLSSFDALNVADTYIEDGSIQKLQLANKQKQEDGAVLLAICSGGTISVYLGETQLVSQTGNAFLGQSNGVIGTMNDLKGSFGTENPESVFTYLGEVYWNDNYNGVMVQYSSNGLFPISSYKMASFFMKSLKKYLNTGSRIVSAFDPTFKECLFILPSIANVATDLPSYDGTPDYATTIQNRFTPYNGNNKAIAFRPSENKWSSFYEFNPEWVESVDTQLYGFKDGRLFKHNSDTENFNKFYGTTVAQRVMFALNAEPTAIKDVQTIAIEGRQIPSCAFIYAEYPNEQITDLVSADFVNKEGVKYASVLRDRLSPNTGSNNPEVNIYKGDLIKSATPLVWVEFQQFGGKLQVNFVDVGYAVSRGHNMISNK